METHFRILSVLWVVYSGVIAVVALVLVVWSLAILGPTQFALGTFLLVVFNVPGIAGGFMLWKGHSWASLILILLATLNLMTFPIGLVVGISTFWLPIGFLLAIYTFWVIIKERIRQQRASAG